MIVKNKYKIKYKNIEDELQVIFPESEDDKTIFYKFRYKKYFNNDYIEFNADGIDKDEYDNLNSIIHIGIKSRNHDKIIGYVRIIRSNPLPIIKDCFDFKEPIWIKFFSNKNLLEISRLIVDKYSDKYFLPRHFVMFLLIKEILLYARDNRIYFGYAFIKNKLMLKFKKIYFPFYKIKNYFQKYNNGPLARYFNQPNNEVIPVYFSYHIMKMYIFFIWIKFNKYIYANS